MTTERVQPPEGNRLPLLEAARPVLDAMAHPVIVTDLDAIIVYWNDAATTMYGHNSAGALGRDVMTLLGVQADVATMRRIGDNVGQGRPWTGEIRVRTRSGAVMTVVLSMTPLLDDDGLVGFIGTSVDVTVAAQNRHRLTEALALADRRSHELRHNALHDSLTDLPNRALILDRAEQMLTRGRRQQVATAALFVDLDHFKTINDTLGHAAGDQVLIEVAARLTGALRNRTPWAVSGATSSSSSSKGRPSTPE